MKPAARSHDYYSSEHYRVGGLALLIWAVAIFVLMAMGIR